VNPGLFSTAYGGDMCGEATRADGDRTIEGKTQLPAFMIITKWLILLLKRQNRFIYERAVNAASPKFFQALANAFFVSGRFGAARLP
jgi:hypothetical protein